MGTVEATNRPSRRTLQSCHTGNAEILQTTSAEHAGVARHMHYRAALQIIVESNCRALQSRATGTPHKEMNRVAEAQLTSHRRARQNTAAEAAHN